jgi:hypothetical protein
MVLGHCCLMLLLASCVSGEKKSKTDYADLKFGSRIVKQTKHPDTIKSPFQNEVYHASHVVKTSEFKSSQYHAEKKFFAGKDKTKYKAGLFSQSKKTSPTGNKTYSGADEKSKLADDTYKTTQNSLGAKMSRSAGQTSSMADDKFNTKGNPAVMKETTNVKSPLFLNDSVPGYSEDQVKKLLNKE